MERLQNDTPRARFAWISADSGSFSDASALFRRAGYAIAEPPVEGVIDVALVDVRSSRLTVKGAQKLAEAARSRAPECGIVFIGGANLTSAERAHLRRFGDLVIAETDLSPVIDICRYRLRIRSIAEETGERLKSVAASTRLSEFPPIETSSKAPSVLIASAPGPLALAALSAAEGVASNCGAALTAGQALRALETGLFDVAVFLPKAEGDPLISLARSLRRHHRFQDLPVIMAAPDEGPRLKLATANAAEAMLPQHLVEDLPARLLAVSRRARLVGAMRRFLAACAGDGVRDRFSGAFTPQFFAQHAERIFARADQTGRPTALVCIRLAPAAPEDGDITAGRTLTEAARLINRVCRAEDFVGRLTRDTFIVLMSGAVAADATFAARRIEGVIANTMFRTRGERNLYAVAAASAAIERTPGSRLDETIAAALARLNGVEPRTAER
ncbi:MAG TPA: diguanylate cyclase [Parvularculaceae bacterium]|nr:diguanylate cyclase [Amphiplicatus sp.]MCB9956194.1 diguanylate cyclase [Caulobacterales bacterium]HPE32340.1 diguanylate cyclase [Parvularculaceae bacterium]